MKVVYVFQTIIIYPDAVDVFKVLREREAQYKAKMTELSASLKKVEKENKSLLLKIELSSNNDNNEIFELKKVKSFSVPKPMFLADFVFAETGGGAEAGDGKGRKQGQR